MTSHDDIQPLSYQFDICVDKYWVKRKSWIQKALDEVRDSLIAADYLQHFILKTVIESTPYSYATAGPVTELIKTQGLYCTH